MRSKPGTDSVLSKSTQHPCCRSAGLSLATVTSRLFIFFVTLFTCSLTVTAQTDTSSQKAKVLLVYDSLDKSTQIYIETYRTEVQKAGFTLDELVTRKPAAADLSKYSYILIYSRVMAFNMMSPVRNWLKAQNSLKNSNICIVTTASKFLEKNNSNDLVNLVKKKNGTLVDAVAAATKNLSSGQKADLVVKHIEKLQK